jgi:hypothetical protein
MALLQKQQPEILGLEFILSHLSKPIFPRKISTYESSNKTFQIDNMDEIIIAFIDSKFIDCRVNAFPLLREGKSWIPDLIFIDLDLSDFKSKKELELLIALILRNISKYFGEDAKPTILWSGNGYHIIQPVNCPVSDYLINQKFKEFVDSRIIINGNAAEEFLRFAKILLSYNKADKNHNPSFRSCLLRFPGTINSKNGSTVKIIQKWNGYRPTITKELFIMFHEYLIQKKIDYNLEQQKQIKDLGKWKRKNHNNNFGNKYGNYYHWIERLLETPVEDCRKEIVELILVHYLVKIKSVHDNEVRQIVKEWLQKCEILRKLDRSWYPDKIINQALRNAHSKQYGPMSKQKIKTNYSNLYFLLVNNEKTKEYF